MADVAILGATGAVGQKAIALLENHPELKVAEVVSQSSGRYSEVVDWKERGAPPDLPLISVDQIQSPYVLSALPADAAKKIERELVARGHTVFSNASAHRMEEDVPLVIPEINSAGSAKLIANPNCTVAVVAMALHPLLALGEIERVSIVSLQATSGAGYGLELEGNIIPYIEGEEEKIECETHKILGTDFPITVHATRVPVLHGHTVVLHVQFREPVGDLREAFLKDPYVIHDDPRHPQPADLTWDDMRIHVGRFKPGGFVALGHNLVRGAAGAAIANMQEVLHGS